MKRSSNDVPFEQSKWWFVDPRAAPVLSRADLPAEEHGLWVLAQPDAPVDWSGDLPDEPIEGFEEWLARWPDGQLGVDDDIDPEPEIDYDAIPASLIERPLITEQVLAQSRPVRFSDWMQDWTNQPSVPRPVPVEVPAFPENPRDFHAYWARWGAANMANLEAEREYYQEVRRRRQQTTPGEHRVAFYRREREARRDLEQSSPRSTGSADEMRWRPPDGTGTPDR